jgi:intracellular sulfur oxidation DsrE/DsrF family protein
VNRQRDLYLEEVPAMKVVIHAPDEGALLRARSCARDLLAGRIPGQVRVLANEDGVIQALAQPDPDMDRLLILCTDSLARRGLEAPRGIETTPNGAVLLTQVQRKGWTYIRT